VCYADGARPPARQAAHRSHLRAGGVGGAVEGGGWVAGNSWRCAPQRSQRSRDRDRRLTSVLVLGEEIRIPPLQLVDRDERHADTVRGRQPRQLRPVDQDDSRVDAFGVLPRIGAKRGGRDEHAS